jgi:hypothetical protein
MPKFGMQAYFVCESGSVLSHFYINPIFLPRQARDKHRENSEREMRFLADEHDAVLTFSANFACRTEGCAPNILNAGYGANLLPVRFLAVSE